jgi:hypothetical protein
VLQSAFAVLNFEKDLGMHFLGGSWFRVFFLFAKTRPYKSRIYFNLVILAFSSYYVVYALLLFVFTNVFRGMMLHFGCKLSGFITSLLQEMRIFNCLNNLYYNLRIMVLKDPSLPIATSHFLHGLI